MTETLVDVRTYELMVLVQPDLSEKEMDALLERIRSFVKNKNGKIVYEEVWGKRRLMYRIKKQDHGIYIVMNFAVEPSSMLEIEQSVRLDHQVMRHLLITVPPHYEMRSYKEDSQLARRPMPGKVDMVTMEQPIAPKRMPAAPIATPGEKPETIVPKKVTQPTIDKLEDIDAKLSSIIDNPDIKL